MQEKLMDLPVICFCKIYFSKQSGFKDQSILRAGTGFEAQQEETDLGIPCQKGNTELVDKINEVLAGLSQEDRDAMMDQAVASQPVSN